MIRRKKAEPAPEPRWPESEVCAFLGIPPESMPLVCERVNITPAPGGPWNQPRTYTWAECLKIQFDHEMRRQEDQRRAEADAEAQRHVLARTGGPTMLVERPGPEAERLYAEARARDQARQDARAAAGLIDPVKGVR